MNFIKDYWSVFLWAITFVSGIVAFIKNNDEATKCSLRNDILTIYEQCREKRQITLYQKQAIHMSADLYFKKKGNSFVKAIVDEIDTFEIKK